MAKLEISASSTTDENIIINAFSTKVCDRWQYRFKKETENTWSSWITYSEKQSSSETIIINNLDWSTRYNVQVRARYSLALYDESSQISVLVSAPLNVYSPQNFFADNPSGDDGEMKITAKIPTYINLDDEGFNATLRFSYLGETLFEKRVLLVDGINTVSFTEEESMFFLKKLEKKTDLVFSVLARYEKGDRGTVTNSVTFHAKTNPLYSSPIFDGFTYQDTNEKTVALTQNNQQMISTQSNLVLTLNSAIALNGSFITNYSVRIGNITKSSTQTEIDMGALNYTGNVAVTVTVYDSRGYSSSITESVPFIEYSKTEITSFLVERINGVQKETRLELSGSIFSIIIDEEERNPLETISYRTKKTSETTFSDWVVIPETLITVSDNVFSANIPQWIDFEEDFSYDVEVMVKDQLTEDTEKTVVPNSQPLLALRKKKVGINNSEPVYALDIVGDLNLTGTIYINGTEIF